MSELQEIIASGKGEHLEFISRIENKHKVAKTLVAFANSNGGSLLIGVKENGKISGINPREEDDIVHEISRELCKPNLEFESIIWNEKHHLVQEIKVMKSAVKGQVLDIDGTWRYYTRVEYHTLQGNKILERIWNLEKYDNIKPVMMDEIAASLLEAIKGEQSATLSKLDKIPNLRNQEVDKILANLVFWKKVQMTMNEAGTFYSVLVE